MMLKTIRKFKNINLAREAYKNCTTKCGIYCFQSKRRKEVYIGMTQNFASRFLQHRKSYSNKHGEHKGLHQLFDKIGLDKTPVQILLEGAPDKYTRTELYIIESLLVEIYLRKGYDVLNAPTGHYWAVSDYKRIGVKKYNRKGILKETYKSIYELVNIYGYNTFSILRCCKAEIKVFGGYKWLLYDGLNDETFMDVAEGLKIHPLTLAESCYQEIVTNRYIHVHRIFGYKLLEYFELRSA